MISHYPGSSLFSSFIELDMADKSEVYAGPARPFHDPTENVSNVRTLAGTTNPTFRRLVAANRLRGHRPDPRILRDRAFESMVRVEADTFGYSSRADKQAELNMFSDEMGMWNEIHEYYTELTGTEDYRMEDLEVVLHMLPRN